MARFVLAGLLLVGGTVAAGATHDGGGHERVETAHDAGEPRLVARLLVHPDDDPARGALRAGVLLEPDPGWHVYWRNPGETGLPTRVEWRLENGKAGPLAWPAPSVFRAAGLVSYGYDEPVLLASALHLDGSLGETDRSLGETDGSLRRTDGSLSETDGSLEETGAAAGSLAAEVEVLVCEDRCIPARFRLERPLASTGTEDGEAVRALFAATAGRLPRPPAELGLEVEVLYGQSAIRPGDDFTAGISVLSCRVSRRGSEDCAVYAPAPGPDAFVPERAIEIELSAEESVAHPLGAKGFVLRVAGRAHAGAPEAPERLGGVLALVAPDGGLRHVALELPLPFAPAGSEVMPRPLPGSREADAPGAAGPRGLALLAVLGLAFLGGVVLNLMPCVLPVLAIKVFAVAELAHRQRGEVLRQGVAYAGGIALSMGVLASGVALLRALGASVGWGFQFQEPLFLAAVAGVVLLFALNLLGVYEITPDTGRLAGAGAEAVGARRSFFEGLLAVVLATPCSAPFLGTAVGFAFAGSVALIFAVFFAIGLGLAAPFVLVTLVPGWARLVPRSGPWMLHLRALLGFALLATVVWLLWVLGRLAGASGMVAVLSLLWVLGLTAWLYGRLQREGRGGAGRAVAALAAVVLLVGIDTVSLSPVESSAQRDDGLLSEDYDAQRVAARVGEGRAAFVYFTADWCLTCKVNERLVLRNPRVQAAFAERDVGVFRADWTQRDDAIRRELERFGRAGVPLYVWYSGAPGAAPELLPELLTPDGVLAKLEQAFAAPLP